MRISIFILIFLLVPSLSMARGISCGSDGDTAEYLSFLSEEKVSPLCSLSSEYLAAFRVSVRPAFEPPSIITIYQRHNGYVEVVSSKEESPQNLDVSKYSDIIQAFKILDISTLESYETLVKKYCLLRPRSPNEFVDEEQKELERKCPMSLDGTQIYIEASYGNSKRTVMRSGQLSGSSSIEDAYLEAANGILSAHKVN